LQKQYINKSFLYTDVTLSKKLLGSEIPDSQRHNSSAKQVSVLYVFVKSIRKVKYEQIISHNVESSLFLCINNKENKN